MKVAFATNDRKTIAKHTGRAKEFAVYELSAYDVINIEYLENDMHHDHDHNHEGHSHKVIVNKLTGVDYLYVNHVGTHFKKELEAAEIKYEITQETEMLSVVEDFFEEETE